jgi:hypothetical protein
LLDAVVEESLSLDSFEEQLSSSDDIFVVFVVAFVFVFVLAFAFVMIYMYVFKIEDVIM